MIRTFIVDDEVPARNELKRFLKEEIDFLVIGEAGDGEKALQDIRRLNPEVVFLDIHIPKLNGLEVAGALSGMEVPPLIVFVTAFDEHAIKAFEVNAIDYMLKPFDKVRFNKSCEKIRNTLQDQKTVREKMRGLTDYLAQQKTSNLVGAKRNSRDRIFINPNDVLYFHVRLTEVIARLQDQQEYILNTTLRSLMEVIDPAQFQQTHRSFIINLNQVEKVSPLFSGNYELVLKDPQKTRIPLSRRFAKQLRKNLKW